MNAKCDCQLYIRGTTLGSVEDEVVSVFGFSKDRCISAGVFLYIEPLVAVVIAAIVLGEPVTWASLLGGAVILFGVWLVNREERERV